MKQKATRTSGLFLIWIASFSEAPMVLQLKIESEQLKFARTDDIEFDIEIVNRGHQAVVVAHDFVWGTHGLGTLDYLVVDTRGEPVERFMRFDPFGLFEDDYNYIKLAPDESVVIPRKFKICDLVKSAGHYKLQVGYFARTELERYEGLPVWNRAAGPVVGALYFEVE